MTRLPSGWWLPWCVIGGAAAWIALGYGALKWMEYVQ